MDFRKSAKYGIIDSHPKKIAKNVEKNPNPYFFGVNLYIYFFGFSNKYKKTMKAMKSRKLQLMTLSREEGP